MVLLNLKYSAKSAQSAGEFCRTKVNIVCGAVIFRVIDYRIMNMVRTISDNQLLSGNLDVQAVRLILERCFSYMRNEVHKFILFLGYPRRSLFNAHKHEIQPVQPPKKHYATGRLFSSHRIQNLFENGRAPLFYTPIIQSEYLSHFSLPNNFMNNKFPCTSAPLYVPPNRPSQHVGLLLCVLCLTSTYSSKITHKNV